MFTQHQLPDDTGLPCCRATNPQSFICHLFVDRSTSGPAVGGIGACMRHGFVPRKPSPRLLILHKKRQYASSGDQPFNDPAQRLRWKGVEVDLSRDHPPFVLASLLGGCFADAPDNNFFGARALLQFGLLITDINLHFPPSHELSQSASGSLPSLSSSKAESP
jgi:hypothetical protein